MDLSDESNRIDETEKMVTLPSNKRMEPTTYSWAFLRDCAIFTPESPTVSGGSSKR